MQVVPLAVKKLDRHGAVNASRYQYCDLHLSHFFKFILLVLVIMVYEVEGNNRTIFSRDLQAE